ncbi:MAG: peptidoglycan bridge formation glycyltransferase FemA/FemB family protein [Candidatus Yanofskybacteria bacterium]|nr:peptidoglycan bridge formation glycyltransferase FemA/FemB family protein [Candidatus Yanofskybacteria bacterium]
MEIREVPNKEEWEEFLAACKEKTFLQSWQWGEFQNTMRGKAWYFGIYERSVLVAAALCVRVRAKRGSFLLFPHGPVVKMQNANLKDQNDNVKFKILETLLEKLREIANKEDVNFIRVNPIWERNEENSRLFSAFGFRRAPIQMHPEASWKLDISLSEEGLLSAMRKTTRYLIRQTQKNEDIQIRQSADLKDVEVFSKLHEKVSARQNFVPFSLEYLKNEFSSFSKDSNISLFIGTVKGEIAAMSFVVFWSGIGFYHHAASLPEYAKLSIPYLLQWEAIREAKRRGCALYDFWGYVDPKTHPNHGWAGPTLFKMGFGGAAHEYVHTQDLPLTWKYWPTAFFEAFRKMKRGL